MMTSKERMERCFYHMETDRPAIYSRTAFPALDPSYDDLKKLFLEKTDLKESWRGFYCRDHEELTEEIPYKEGYVKQKARIKTPKGDLTQTTVISTLDRSSSVIEYFIKDEEDMEKYLSLPDGEVSIRPEEYYGALKKIGDRGIVVSYLGSNPAGFTAALCGSENFALFSVTSRDLLHKMCLKKMNSIIRLLKEFGREKIGEFFAMQGEEYITPPLHGPKDFDDFNVKYDKPIIDLVHEMGGRMHIHCHGSVKNVIDGFIHMGVDVLHPFEDYPLGDITIKEAKEKVKDKITIEGNIEISLMYEKSPEEIGQIARNIMDEAFYDRKGLIVSPTASPCFYGKGGDCYEQYVALIDAVLDFKN